ncbi:MAG: PmoA family protein, partial [Planctomycetaceae bacterium]|nr:PmoA family protein [Planctomycetaceae bacterium]
MKHIAIVLSLLTLGFTAAEENTNEDAAKSVALPQAPAKLQSDGKLIAEYRYADVPNKPYVTTLRTPSGKNVLRDAPHDHKHHHALMFALAVNGTNFWEEAPNAGKEITESISAQPSSLNTFVVWQNAAGKVLLKEDRMISVTGSPEVTLLDWQSVLKHPTDLPNDPPVDFDKSAHHYYGLGVRFDQSMDKQGR